MAIRETPVCDRCGEDIVFDHTLGDKNAGPVRVGLPGYTVELDLCVKCMGELLDWMGKRLPTSYSGTVDGVAKLYYLPWKGETPPASAGGGLAKPFPPSFQG